MLFPTRKLLLVSGAMLAGIVSLMPAPSGTAATVVAPRPQQTIIVGTESGAAVLQVLNLGTGGAVIGQVGASEIGAATGAGLYGVFNPPSGVGEGVLGFASNGTGIVAETFGGAYAAIYAQNYSSAAEPAIQGVSNGNSIVGTSADSNSIVGITNDPTHPRFNQAERLHSSKQRDSSRKPWQAARSFLSGCMNGWMEQQYSRISV